MRRSGVFDSLRIIAALCVIFSHSFLISEGHEEKEPLQMLTGEILGIYAVFVFFIISGYLITASRVATPTLAGYAWKRALRLYPGYLASLLICFVVIGPFFVNGSLRDYVGGWWTWTSFARALGFDYIWDFTLIIPRVSFFEGDVGRVANGVIWTLVAEMQLYVVVAVLFSLRALNAWVTAALCLVSFVFFYTGNFVSMQLFPIIYGAPAFFAGATLYFVLRDRTPSGPVAAVFCVFLVEATIAGELPKLFPILAAYPVIYLGLKEGLTLGPWTRFGDLSYGIYIGGWPIQMAVAGLVGTGLSGWQFFPLCVVPVLAYALLSWHLVEKRALGLKGLLGRQPVEPLVESRSR
ncbi:acyltransferase family protein [Rhodobacterales bacterium HKCCE2091]|nr:acyltransferase family protein [Rhodobacterales bacterium HKCCE2091]